MSNDGLQLDSYQLESSKGIHRIQANINDGENIQLVHGSGNGAISAFTDAIHKAYGIQVGIVQFDEQAVEEGTEAKAIAFVQANINGQRYTAAAQDEDTVQASIRAILTAVSQSEAVASGHTQTA